jgi:hypothetical protein
MIEAVTKGVAKDVGVTLLDSLDVPVTGVLFGSVTVRFRKNGAAGFTTKSVLAGEWNEVGDGIYLLTFTAGELDTAGNFRFLVDGGAFDRHEHDLLVINEQLSLNQQIVDLKAALAGLANIRDVDTLFAQKELRIQELERRLRDVNRRLSIAQTQLSALRST